MKKPVYLWVLLLILITQNLSAQVKDTMIWQIITKDGNEFYGTIVEESIVRLKLMTKEFGEIEIKTKIKSGVENTG